MWSSFVVAVVVAVILLYVPGSLVLRGAGLSAPLAVAEEGSRHRFRDVTAFNTTMFLDARLGVTVSLGSTFTEGARITWITGE